MSYAVAKKNMASSTYSGGRSSNSKYIVQKASGSNAYGTATSAINASKHSNLQQFNHKYGAKVNSHLLDHGYGAAPQTSTYDDANTSRISNDSGNFKCYTNSTDGSITKYYKVCYSLCYSLSSVHTVHKHICIESILMQLYSIEYSNEIM